MRVGVFIPLLGGLHELPYESRIGGYGLVAGDNADGVGVAWHAIIRLGEAVELRAVHIGLHPFPSGVEAAKIGFAAGQRLECGCAHGHFVERAFAAVRLDHAADHRVGFVRAERGEGLAIEILRGFDRLVRGERTPDGARLLLHLHNLFDLRALGGVHAHVGQIRQREIGLAVVRRLFGAGLCHRHDVHIKADLLEVPLVLRHVDADVVGVWRP